MIPFPDLITFYDQLALKYQKLKGNKKKRIEYKTSYSLQDIIDNNAKNTFQVKNTANPCNDIIACC